MSKSTIKGNNVQARSWAVWCWRSLRYRRRHCDVISPDQQDVAQVFASAKPLLPNHSCGGAMLQGLLASYDVESLRMENIAALRRLIAGLRYSRSRC